MDRRCLSAAIALVLAGPVRRCAGVGGTDRPGDGHSSGESRHLVRPGRAVRPHHCARLAARHPQARQFVIVEADQATATSGTLQIVARSTTGEWRCQQPPVAARLGKSGVRPLAERRSGDGTTPAGVFPLGTVRAWDGERFQFFGNRPDPGVRGLYPQRAPGGLLGCDAAVTDLPATGRPSRLHVAG
jgi:hypothetical protein